MDGQTICRIFWMITLGSSRKFGQTFEKNLFVYVQNVYINSLVLPKSNFNKISGIDVMSKFS